MARSAGVPRSRRLRRRDQTASPTNTTIANAASANTPVPLIAESRSVREPHSAQAMRHVGHLQADNVTALAVVQLADLVEDVVAV